MTTNSENITEQQTDLHGQDGFIAGPDDRILITGAAGFIGCRVVRCLLDRGFRNLVCFVRPSSDMSDLDVMIESLSAGVRIDVVKGNLLAPKDCEAASKGVAVILHLAAGTGEKSFPDAFLNSVVATRNLLDASVQYASLRRFLLVSSFAVYSNREKPNGRLLDESCPIDARPELRGEAYCFAKVKQEEIVNEYGKNHGIPYVIVRPGSVYGPVASEPTGRIGIGTFGPYLHLGGSNTIPFTNVDNCAEAMVLAAVTRGVDGQVFNIVDDNLPSSRKFLRLYKKSVGSFRSIYLPHSLSYALCFMWEKYSDWSKGQLPPVFNRRRWHVEWKKTRFSNKKLKTQLGWKPRVSTEEGLRQYAEACGRKRKHA